MRALQNKPHYLISEARLPLHFENPGLRRKRRNRQRFCRFRVFRVYGFRGLGFSAMRCDTSKLKIFKVSHTSDARVCTSAETLARESPDHSCPRCFALLQV